MMMIFGLLVSESIKIVSDYEVLFLFNTQED